MSNEDRPRWHWPRRRRRPGRPALPSHELRSISLGVRLSPTEYARIRMAAEECAMPVSAYVRAEALQLRIRPPAVPKANLIYVGELCRLGNNLNQLLVLIYTNRAPLGLMSTVEDLLEKLDELKAILLGEEKTGQW